MNIPILQTSRLILRPFTLEDGPRVQELAGNARVADTTLNIPHPYPDGVAAAWIATQPKLAAEDNEIAWAITSLETQTFFGAISLMPRVNSHYNLGELGYWLGLPYWNQGFMTEAVKSVVRYGFDTLKLHRIHAAAFSRNPASIRVMEKAGMRFEGIARGRMLKNGVFEDVSSCAILITDQP
jgi:[ribosomal protein S5]-alanine N-acetyltransferase